MKIAKAVVAAVVSAGGALGTALADDRVTSSEWAAVLVAGVVALGAVYGVPNKRVDV